MNHSDAHAHLNEINTDTDVFHFKETDIIFSCSSHVGNWAATEKIASEHKNVIPFFGTHPWFIDTYNGPHELKEYLEKNQRAGIGEIGLDSKRGTLQDQMPVFIEQLNVAKEMDRLVTIHMVAAEEHILRALKNTRITSILHSFSGPVSYIRPFTECGCYFSVSPRLLSKSKEKTAALLKAIPSDRLLLESDAPNNRASIDNLIDIAAPILLMDRDELSSLTADNMRRIVP